MKLRNKITIILLSLWCIMVVIAFIGSQRIINQSYLDLEQNQVKADIQRVKEAIQQMSSSINTLLTNWAAWDDTYKFINDLNPAYIKTNLNLNSFISADVNMIFYFNANFQPVYLAAVNIDKTDEAAIPIEIFKYLSPQGRLVRQPYPNSDVQGLIALKSSLLLVCAHSIVTSDFKGPVRGTLIMAKYLSDTALKQLEKTTKINLSIYPLTNQNMDKSQVSIYEKLQKNNQFLIERNNETLISGYTLLNDINDKPIAILKIELPRNLYQIGIKTIHYYNKVFIIYSIILVALLWYLLQELLVKRLEKLKGQIDNTNSINIPSNSLIIGGISDEVSTVASLYYQATHDHLTGLANRNLLEQMFNNNINKIKNSNSKIAILFLDIDHFKRVNDSLGHEVGDELLVLMGKRLNQCLRDNDLAARIGGDEFVIMLIGIDNNQIKTVIERIYKTLSEPILIKDHELHITSSMGISIYPLDGFEINTLLKHADIALYHAKESGRNHYQYYSDELNRAIQEAYKKEAELQRAIDNKELCLFYQPIYDAITVKIISLETLIRWKHPTRGLLAANEIIPLAEKCGLIIPIGKWVLETACQQAKKWQQQGILTAPIAINISVLQTKNTSIDKLVSTVLKETGLDPHYLELELTETSYVEITEKILGELRVLKEKGIQLAVDDFGVGYSGIGYLRKLPISKLKIDQSFIKDICTDPDDSAITLAIIAIAHQLNLQVIAEGVENVAQYNFLKMNHVDAVQGNYFCKPMDTTKCEDLLKTLTSEVFS